MDPLIQVTDLETRLGRTLSSTQTTQAEALIDDASALVGDIADTDFLDDAGDLDVPPAIVPVVVKMVRRELENPRGLTMETIGGYTWQSQTQGGPGTLYATRSEKRTIRRAVSKLGAGSAQLEGYMPLRTFAFEDELIGSL